MISKIQKVVTKNKIVGKRLHYFFFNSVHPKMPSMKRQAIEWKKRVENK